MEWDAPWDPWLSTVRTARAGSGPQQVVADPWVTGYRVERREYVVGAGGDWFLPESEDEAIWSATMTVGSSTTGTPATGYFGLGSNPYGAMTQTTFTHPVGSGSWGVNGLLVTAGELRLGIEETGTGTDDLPTSEFAHWVLVVDGRSFPFDLPEGNVGVGLTVVWPNPGLNWTDGQQVSVHLVERIDWETLRDETDGDAGTSFTDARTRGTGSTCTRSGPTTNGGLPTTLSGATGPSTAGTRADTRCRRRNHNSGRSPSRTVPPTTRRRPIPRPQVLPPSVGRPRWKRPLRQTPRP